MTDLAARAIEQIESRGGSMGQQALRDHLGIMPEEFQALKTELLELGKVVTYRARGGGIRLVTETKSVPDIDQEAFTKARSTEEETAKQLLTSSTDEKALYPYVQNWLLNNKKYGFEFAKIIGDNHRRRTWENPDVIALTAYEYENFAGLEVEIASVEIKLAFTIYAVWQAANYRRFSHQVFLACYEQPDVMLSKEDGRLIEICHHLGIGLLALTPAGREASGVKCAEIISPAFAAPSRIELDMFLTDFGDLLDLPSPGRVITNQINAAIR